MDMSLMRELTSDQLKTDLQIGRASCRERV